MVKDEHQEEGLIFFLFCLQSNTTQIQSKRVKWNIIKTMILVVSVDDIYLLTLTYRLAVSSLDLVLVYDLV